MGDPRSPIAHPLRAVRDDYQNGVGCEHPNELLEDIVGGVVGPVPILEQHHEWGARRSLREDRAQSFEQRESEIFTLEVARGRIGVAVD